jgi:hypothetical protein
VEKLFYSNVFGGGISAGTATVISGLISAPVCLSLLSDKAFPQKLAFLEAVKFAEDEARFRLF